MQGHGDVGPLPSTELPRAPTPECQPRRPPALCSSSRALTSSLRLKWPSASCLHGHPVGQPLRGKCAPGRTVRRPPSLQGPGLGPQVHGAARRRREGSDTATLQNRLPSPRPGLPAAPSPRAGPRQSAEAARKGRLGGENAGPGKRAVALPAFRKVTAPLPPALPPP